MSGINFILDFFWLVFAQHSFLHLNFSLSVFLHFRYISYKQHRQTIFEANDNINLLSRVFGLFIYILIADLFVIISTTLSCTYKYVLFFLWFLPANFSTLLDCFCFYFHFPSFTIFLSYIQPLVPLSFVTVIFFKLIISIFPPYNKKTCRTLIPWVQFHLIFYCYLCFYTYSLLFKKPSLLFYMFNIF